MVKTFGPPTVNTHGEVGDVYVDYETGVVYRCVEVIPDIDVNEYQFVKVGEHGPNTQYIWEQEMVMNCNYKAQLEGGNTAFVMGSLLGSGDRIVIPEGFETITNCQMNYLSSVHIPSTVTTIAMTAFQGTTRLKTITIPNNVTTIQFEDDGTTITGPFSGCTALEEIIVDAEEGSIEGAPWGAPGTPSGPVKVTWCR